MSQAEVIARVLAKLAELRARGVDTFGARSHRFELAPPLSEEAVSAFERAHGVALPPDFRAFVTLAGGSGAGPFHGLLPIDRWGEALHGDEPCPDWLARPCLFSPDDLRDGRRYESLVGDAPEPFQGAIAIVDQGCSYLGLLAVTGPHAGRVLYVNLDGGTPFFVESPDFLTWYERWLDELRWGHSHFWFGMDMPGDEATLASVAADPSSPRRRDALAAMYRLPALAEPTRDVALARARDDDPKVRAIALSLLGRRSVAPAEPIVRAALADPDEGVRLEAHRALRALGVEWHAAARAALLDPAPAIVADAVRELGRAKAIDAEAALSLLPGATTEVAQWALIALEAPSPVAAEGLLARERAGGTPSGLHALIAQVRGGATSHEQESEILAIVLAQLAAEPAYRARLLAGLALLSARHPRALDALVDLTSAKEGFARFEAAAALGDLAATDAPSLARASAALEALAVDATMPREAKRSTAWSVGENARRALAKLRARSAAP